jgi:uncharacterized protein
MDLISLLKAPWPWYVSGALIAMLMATLIYWGKTFGFSSNFRTICSMAGAGRYVDFFRFDWRTQQWNLLFLVGAALGGWIAGHYLQNPGDIRISAQTIDDLRGMGIGFGGELNPPELFSAAALMNVKTIVLLLLGGLLVGFGSRYAGGCTSGHAITGLSNLQLPSLAAVIGFFAGGLIMSWLILPLIL